MREITKFKGKPYRSGGSYVILVPKSKFTEKILDPDKEYEFCVCEVE